MEVKTACENLELNMPFDERMLKKQYHKMALKYHPDKNKEIGAEDRFKMIGSSYTFLSTQLNLKHSEETENCQYNDILNSFIRFFYSDKNENSDYSSVFYRIISKLTVNFNETLLDELCSEIDSSILTDLYEFIKKYETMLNIDKKVIDSLRKYMLVRNTESNANIYIVNPKLDDLFENNIHKVTIREKTIYVPMWHSELVYEFDKSEFVVKCIPDLPEHVNIDERNNLHVYLKLRFDSILMIPEILFKLGSKREYTINVSELHIKQNQIYILRNKGISLINEKNVYDDSRRSNIVVHIEFM